MPAAPKRRRRRAQRAPRRPPPRPRDVFEDFLDDADPIDAVVDQLFDNPQVQGGFQWLQEQLDKFGFAVDRVARPRIGPSGPQQPPPRRPAAPPPPPPRVDPLAEARGVLHFGPTEKLTREIVKRRRKDLAAMCHPDKGGSVESMQRVNAAADALLKAL